MKRDKNQVYMPCEECAVRKDSMFNVLCSHEMSNLSDAKTCTTYKKGQILFHEGTRPLGVFCINKGKVKVYKLGLNGKEQILFIAKNGDLLGYKAMIGEESYSVTGEALEDSTACFVPKTEFMEMLKDSPDFQDSLLKAVCKQHGVLADKITGLAQKSVRERFAAALLMLKDTYGMEGQPDGQPVEINLTREDLANIVGTATESLITLLHDFKEEGLVETQGRKIRVLDAAKLMRVANIY